MKIETAKRLKRAGKKLGLKVEGRKTYSGRFMFGQNTPALVIEHLSDLLACAAMAGSRLRGANLEDFAYELKDLRTDNMGKGYVVY
jgi:hypothetical protein